ncbi:MAG: DMT family transporter, partial [Acidobacteriota bacterium]
VAASTLLVSTQPAFSAVLSSVALRERPAGRAIGGIGLSLLGIALIAVSDLRAGGGRLAGDLLALLGALFAAGYFVIGRGVRAGVSFAAYLLVVNGSAAGAAALLALAFGQPLVPSGGDGAWLVLMAVVPHLLGHGALNWAVRRVRAYLVNLSALGEPVLASVYALLLFGEAPGAMLYPGALMIGAGVALALAERTGEPR